MNMTTRKRSGSGSKRQFKEKVVQIYECLLKGEDVSNQNILFWEEFFLLKPNITTLENEILKISTEQLQTAKQNINILLNQCIVILDQRDQQHSIRVAYGFLTLCVVLHSLFRKSMESQLDAMELLSGCDNFAVKIQKLLNVCQNYLEGKFVVKLLFYKPLEE